MNQVEKESIFRICDFINQTYNIKTTLINENGDAIYGFNKNQLMLLLGIKNLDEIRIKTTENKAAIIKTKFESFVAGFSFIVDMKMIMLIIGPAYPERVSSQAIYSYCTRLGYSEEDREVLCQAGNSLPSYGINEFAKIIQTAYFCAFNEIIFAEDLVREGFDADEVSKDIYYNTDYEIVEPRASSRLHLYRDYLLECVKADAIQRLESGIGYAFGTGLMDSFLKKPLQDAKNDFIIMLTLCSVSAVEGSLHREIAKLIRDAYIERANTASNTEQIASLYRESMSEFTKKVDSVLPEKGYSFHVKKCCPHIRRYICQPLRAQQIASDLGVSQEHLSRIFKKEVGMSVSDYIRRIKVNESKYMMLYTDYSLSQISQMLSFCSQSHFCEAFKKEEGITPKEYIILRRKK